MEPTRASLWGDILNSNSPMVEAGVFADLE